MKYPSTTVVFVVDALQSHLYASVGLARRLRRLGFSVEYWGSGRNGSAALIQGQGFPFHVLPALWSRYQDDTRLPTDLKISNLLPRWRELASKIRARRARWRSLPGELQVFEDALRSRAAHIRPCFAIFDSFVLAYYPFFHHLNIPSVVVSTKPLPVRDPLVPPYGSALVPRLARWPRLAVLAAWVRPLALDVAYRACCAVARAARLFTNDDILRLASKRTGYPLHQNRVRRWVHPDLHLKTVQEWALWTKETDLPRARPLPANVHYIGPSVDVVRAQEDLPFRPVRGGVLVYVAVGTARFRWQDNVRFLQKVIDTFSGTPDITVAISAGDERTVEALSSGRSNIHIFPFAPQIRMLQKSNLVITHMGAGTFRECIEFGVPMLAYPRNHDQIGNTARVVHHGIGLSGDRHRDTPNDIRQKTLRLLFDASVRRNLSRLREAVHRQEDDLLTGAIAALGVQLPEPVYQVSAASAE